MIFMPFIIAFVFAYLGLLAPGMLNLTACKISVDRGAKEALQFSIGASLIVLIQAYIALTFTKLLSNNPSIIEYVNGVGVLVFFALAIYFFNQARKKTRINTPKKQKKANYFLLGMGLSTINALAIPFYLTIGIYSEQKGYMKMVQTDKILFVLGASFGVFLLLRTYCRFAQLILVKSRLIAEYYNYILSGIFLTLGVVTLIKLI